MPTSCECNSFSALHGSNSCKTDYEIDKFVVVLALNHASLFGDATYKINLSRQTKPETATKFASASG